jgi:hypothetical protein
MKNLTRVKPSNTTNLKKDKKNYKGDDEKLPCKILIYDQASKVRR